MLRLGRRGEAKVALARALRVDPYSEDVRRRVKQFLDAADAADAAVAASRAPTR
jgi:hypothetical protein